MVNNTFTKNTKGNIFMNDEQVFLHKRRILFKSRKNNNELIVCDSPYSFIYCSEFLENDDRIVSYVSGVRYKTAKGKEHTIDFLINYKEEKLIAVTVLDSKRLGESNEKIKNSEKYSLDNNWKHKIITEIDLGINSYETALSKVKDYCENHKNINEKTYLAIKNNERVKKYYHENKKYDKIDVYCNFCKNHHNIAKKQYERNVLKNGRFICIVENGSIVGKKPKKHLIKENIYAIEGKKECIKCGSIKVFNEFSPDNSRRDGYSSVCKVCRAERYKQKYHDDKNKINKSQH